MIVAIDSAGHLGVPNDIFVAVQNQKVWVADNFTFDGIEEGHYSKGRLVDNSGSYRNRLLRFGVPFLLRHFAQVHNGTKTLQMLLRVTATQFL